jgi:hypothetical protein
MRRKIILVALLIVGLALCTGPLWGLFATLSGLISTLQKISGGAGGTQEMAGELLVGTLSLAGWIALPLGLATVIGTSLLLAGVRRKWVVATGALVPVALGGIVALTDVGPLLVFLTFLAVEQNSGPFDQPRFTAIVQQVKAVGIRPGETLLLRLDDLANPKSLHIFKPKPHEMPSRGDEAGFVWAEVTADGKLKVVIETKDLGHAGQYGYAYTEAGPPKQTSDEGGCDLPGPLNRVDKKIDEHWSAVENPLMD